MPDTFDPYREALVMETEIAWPDGYEERDASELTRIAAALHATPEEAEQIEYIRTHTGFCRRIIATEADIARVTE